MRDFLLRRRALLALPRVLQLESVPAGQRSSAATQLELAQVPFPGPSDHLDEPLRALAEHPTLSWFVYVYLRDSVSDGHERRRFALWLGRQLAAASEANSVPINGGARQHDLLDDAFGWDKPMADGATPRTKWTSFLAAVLDKIHPPANDAAAGVPSSVPAPAAAAAAAAAFSSAASSPLPALGRSVQPPAPTIEITHGGTIHAPGLSRRDLRLVSPKGLVANLGDGLQCPHCQCERSLAVGV